MSLEASLRSVGARIAPVVGLLLVARLGHAVPLPGLDPETLSAMNWGRMGVLGSMIGSGAIHHVSLFALGMTPFVSAWMLVAVFAGGLPAKDAARARQWLTAALAVLQAFGVANGLNNYPDLVYERGVALVLTAALTMTAGTMLLMWLGEQITRRGVCDGIWLLVAVDSIAKAPATVAHIAELVQTGAISSESLIPLAALVAGLIAIIVLIESAVRPITGIGDATGAQTRLALPVDRVTIMPLTLAGLLLTIPVALAGMKTNGLLHALLLAALIVVCTFLAAALREGGARYVRQVGPAPGRTAAFVDLRAIETRLVAICSGYLAVIGVAPAIVSALFDLPALITPWSLLVIAIVMLDILHRAPAGVPADQTVAT